VKLNTRICHIKPYLCEWLYEAWQHVLTKQNFIMKGWAHARLMRRFIPKFQLEAVEKKSTTPLFKPTTIKLKNKNLTAAFNVDLVVDSNNDTKKDFSIVTTMDSDDGYYVEDSID
jgi:hypothetical protein